MGRWGQEKPAPFVCTEETGVRLKENYNKKYKIYILSLGCNAWRACWI